MFFYKFFFEGNFGLFHVFEKMQDGNLPLFGRF